MVWPPGPPPSPWDHGEDGQDRMVDKVYKSEVDRYRLSGRPGITWTNRMKVCQRGMNITQGK